MVINTKKGYYRVLKNVLEAFDLQKFEEAYIEELYDKYEYIVGDISDSILRLKGFSTKPNTPTYFHNIPDYLQESCNYRTPYYILKRITEKEYEDMRTLKDDKVTQGYADRFIITKEAFDKDALVLEKTLPNKKHIVIDTIKMNEVSTYELSDDLKEEIIKSRQAEQATKKVQKPQRDRTFNQSRNFFNNKNKNNKEPKVFEHVNSKKD